jgi:hypothetical protein
LLKNYIPRRAPMRHVASRYRRQRFQPRPAGTTASKPTTPGVTLPRRSTPDHFASGFNIFSAAAGRRQNRTANRFKRGIHNFDRDGKDLMEILTTVTNDPAPANFPPPMRVPTITLPPAPTTQRWNYSRLFLTD